MMQFPENIQFKYPWRKYQQRVLNELESHLTDNHLHIIAPPGSGKTVLGLEVSIRLNKPTLIFAPTIAIRNQWIQRFCELFLQQDETPDWISRNIRKPAFLTVSTYQGLYAACNNLADYEEDDEELGLEEDEDAHNSSNPKPRPRRKKIDNSAEVIALLKAQNIGTIVVDEAHHLKNAWWDSLNSVKAALKPTIVGLTATPPYDSSFAEWQRYSQLNGPVDAEISVPELVIENDLCPHQDYIHFSEPNMNEKQRLREYRKRLKDLVTIIGSDIEFIQNLKKHPYYTEPHKHLKTLYSSMEFYSSMLIFMHHVGQEITKHHLEVVGSKHLEIPELDSNWLEMLLNYYHTQNDVVFKECVEHKEKMFNMLKRNGAVERGRIILNNGKRMSGILSRSISKMDSIQSIVDFEFSTLKNKLRMVILTDFIRKEFLPSNENDTPELNKIGVIPIFEMLRRANPHQIKLGVLSGSLIVIPKSAHEAFMASCISHGHHNVKCSPYPCDGNYIVVTSSEQLKHDIVHIITGIFEQGHIEVLTGTKSLLGEGWDAPSINSLILASFVGSFVLSNQMRGRAIRTQRDNPEKTGHIWHLVCVDVEEEFGGEDFDLMSRRFRAFAGVTRTGQANIENSISRMQLPDNRQDKAKVDFLNNEMLESASERKRLIHRWQEALLKGNTLIEEIEIPFPSKKKTYKRSRAVYLRKTISSLFVSLGSGITAFSEVYSEAFSRSLSHMKSPKDVIIFITAMLGITSLFFGRRFFRAMRLYIKYRDISKDIKNIGKALVMTMCRVEIIKTDFNTLKVVSNKDETGAVFCHMEGGTTFERSLFLSALQETVSSVDSPRYIIQRKSLLFDILPQKDYHPVPEVLSKNKSTAELFANQWIRYVGNCKLISTRTIAGRKIVLKSRISSLSAQFQKKSDRKHKWL
jgi:superfamily II DNA or RNA helicase